MCASKHTHREGETKRRVKMKTGAIHTHTSHTEMEKSQKLLVDTNLGIS